VAASSLYFFRSKEGSKNMRTCLVVIALIALALAPAHARDKKGVTNSLGDARKDVEDARTLPDYKPEPKPPSANCHQRRANLADSKQLAWGSLCAALGDEAEADRVLVNLQADAKKRGHTLEQMVSMYLAALRAIQGAQEQERFRSQRSR
jgi:hypothetical protein